MTNVKTANRSPWRYSAVELGHPFGLHLDCDSLQDAVVWAARNGLDVNVWRNLDGNLARELRNAV